MGSGSAKSLIREPLLIRVWSDTLPSGTRLTPHLRDVRIPKHLWWCRPCILIQMSETIQMRQTDTSGDYHVFAAKGDDPVKGLALHTDLTSRLDGEFDSGDQYVAVEFSEGGAIELSADKFTGSTFRVANEPAVRHAYFTPQFVASYDMEDIPTEETFDVEGFPAIGISDLSLSDEETYDEEQNSTADEAADALFGEEEGQDSDEAEADSEEAEEAQISDEEIGIVEG